MSVRDLIMSAAGAEVKRVYPEDVFSADIYAGNNATNKITNKLDLAGKGGFILFKARSQFYDPTFIDTTMPNTTYKLWTNDTASLQPGDNTPGKDLVSFDSDGFTLGPGYNMSINNPNTSFVAWSFKKDPKFFNMVTWTGDGIDGRGISTGLSVPKGLVIVKKLDNVSPWSVLNSDTAYRLYLNTSDPQKQTVDLPNGSVTNGSDPYSFVLTAGTTGLANVNFVGGKYIAYVFGDDDTPTSVIKTGSYTGNGSTTGPVINLGWEPQFVLIKNATGAGVWQIVDNSRGMYIDIANPLLSPNNADTESTDTVLNITSTGFQIKTSVSQTNASGNTYIYMAIKRPCKPPVSGTEVYKAIVRTGTGAATKITGVGFKPDMATLIDRGTSQFSYKYVVDRLRGSRVLATPATVSEAPISTYGGDLIWTNDGFNATDTNPLLSGSSGPYINHFFKRAIGFFDIVTYTGNAAAMNLVHGLETKPELVIFKRRGNTGNWVVWDKFDKAGGKFILLNSDAPATLLPSDMFSTDPTDTVFSLGSNASVSSDYHINLNNYAYIAYMFATLKGVSKVGTYAGNGSTNQTIDCGFTTGARFVMVKAMDSTGDWYVLDTTRGIVVGNDPRISLNAQSVAEVTNTDYVDPATVGFIAKGPINNLTTNYLYLAIA